MTKIMVEHNTETNQYTVLGSIASGEFVISGPWETQADAEAHAQKVIALFNEAVAEITKKPSLDSLILS